MCCSLCGVLGLLMALCFFGVLCGFNGFFVGVIKLKWFVKQLKYYFDYTIINYFCVFVLNWRVLIFLYIKCGCVVVCFGGMCWRSMI